MVTCRLTCSQLFNVPPFFPSCPYVAPFLFAPYTHIQTRNTAHTMHTHIQWLDRKSRVNQPSHPPLNSKQSGACLWKYSVLLPIMSAERRKKMIGPHKERMAEFKGWSRGHIWPKKQKWENVPRFVQKEKHGGRYSQSFA
jgi:hypothetical protein